MCDRIDLLKKIEELEKENFLMKEAIDQQDWVINNLQKALDKAYLQLEKDSMHKVDTGYYGKTSFFNKEKWKVWCLNDE